MPGVLHVPTDPLPKEERAAAKTWQLNQRLMKRRRGWEGGWEEPGKIAQPKTEIGRLAALRAWLEAAGITEGAIFRRVFNKRAQRVTDRRLAARNVATIVKAAAVKLGLEAAAFAGHSLRAGFVTSAVKRGANLIKITT
jgi:hypothetical protein